MFLFSLQYQATRLTWLSPAQFCMVFVLSSHRVGMAELFFVVILVPMGNHSSSEFRRSTHIKVHVRCGLMPGHAHATSDTHFAISVHGLMPQILCIGLLTRTGTLQRSLSRGCVLFHVSFRRVSDHHAHTSQLCNSARAIANAAVRATCEPCGSPFVHMAFVQASNKWKHALVDS